jgi:hypothetical protein
VRGVKVDVLQSAATSGVVLSTVRHAAADYRVVMVGDCSVDPLAR